MPQSDIINFLVLTNNIIVFGLILYIIHLNFFKTNYILTIIKNIFNSLAIVSRI